MHTYYLHIGSNQGNRTLNLSLCLEAIVKQIGEIGKSSSVYETEPWGLKEQAPFLNQAISCYSAIPPVEVLAKCKSIEASLGPEKEQKWGPRTIDIDILYCDDLIDDGDPQLPHPQVANRNFVLVPLMEIADEFVDPKRNKTIEELYDDCEDSCEVYFFDEEE